MPRKQSSIWATGPPFRPSNWRHGGLSLKRPDEKDHGNRNDDDQNLERQAHAPVVAELVAAGAHDEGVVLDVGPKRTYYQGHAP